MRTAIISDIHGNYPALLSVMEDAKQNKVDKFVFLGDYIFDLPYGNEVANLLMELKNAYIIKGNKETALVRLSTEDQSTWVYNQIGAIYQTYRELTPEAFSFLAGLPEELLIQLSPDTSLYAVHTLKSFKPSAKNSCGSASFHRKMLAKPFTHEEFLSEFAELMNTEENKEYIGSIDATVIAFGHNHLQSHCFCGDKLIINPGSCGQPLDFQTTAPYTILEETDGKLSVIEKRVAYDIESVISYSKNSAIYREGRIWSELCYLALRTGKDYFGTFFGIANDIMNKRHETGEYFSNETWDEAYQIFINKGDL